MSNMPEETEPKEQQPSPEVQEAVDRLYKWLFQQVAEGEPVDKDRVLQEIDSYPALTSTEFMEVFHLLDAKNEVLRSELPKSASDDARYGQVKTHEEITSLIWEANDAKLETEGFYEES
jgi:hypothetical protein